MTTVPTGTSTNATVTTAPAPWTGTWAARELGISLRTASGVGPLTATDLVGLAVRRNPRRSHLLVSRVLGKHVPTDPRVVDGAGRLLGALVAGALDPGALDPGVSYPGADVTVAAGHLARTLRGEVGTAAELAATPLTVSRPAVVLGYAETATALGHTVAATLGAWYVHTTRVPGGPELVRFEESHSHATTHLVRPQDPQPLRRGTEPLVLVDDELSTGRTAAATIEALHRVAPRRHYVLATLIDLRGTNDRRRLADLADRLRVRIDVVALVTADLGLPADVLARGNRLAGAAALAPPAPASPTHPRARTVGVVPVKWPAGRPAGGSHGLDPAQTLELTHLAATIAGALDVGPDVLVLGTEELLFLPLQLGLALSERVPSATVRVSSTTRSPVVPIDRPDYAIRDALTFPAPDADGPRFAYNVRHAGATDVVVVTDDLADPRRLNAGLLSRLTEVAGGVHLVVVPSGQPAGR